MTVALASGLLGYLLGSLLPGVWLSRRLRGIDLRDHGSGGAGATNAVRVLGWGPGLVVLLGDAAKGYAAAAVAAPLGGNPLAAGLGVLAGGLWPAYFGLRGGKGVATAAGVLAALDPRVLLVCVGVFLAILAWRRIVSLASIAAAVALPATVAGRSLAGGREGTTAIVFTLAVAGLLILSHRDNLTRLRQGTEPSLGGDGVSAERN